MFISLISPGFGRTHMHSLETELEALMRTTLILEGQIVLNLFVALGPQEKLAI